MDQHCVVAEWYSEAYNIYGAMKPADATGIGHFSALAWKGTNRLGCGSRGPYYVCEYGSSHCMQADAGENITGCYGTPAGVPNMNWHLCGMSDCVDAKQDRRLLVPCACPEDEYYQNAADNQDATETYNDLITHPLPAARARTGMKLKMQVSQRPAADVPKRGLT
jgi:hypothetical protein